MRSLLCFTLLAGLAAAVSAMEDPPAGDSSLMPKVKFETTLGSFVVELDGSKAPISTWNFVQYVDSKFYEGTIFHRVITDFMIQGGGHLPDMEEKKSGRRDPIRNEWQNGLKNNRGAIAMARTAAPHSATAQFFINVVDNPRLDDPRTGGGSAYAVFGKVVEGMDVVDKIRDTPLMEHPKYPSGGKAVTPKEPVVIQSTTVVNEIDRSKLEQAAKAATSASEQAESAEKAQREAAAAQAAASKGKVDAARKAEQEQAVQAYLAKAAAETGKAIEKADSGFYYLVLKPGDGASPKPTDRVSVHYVGTLLDGTEFDSSVKRGQPAEFRLTEVIRGWTEGVGMMKVGEKRRLVLPPNLAYGEAGRPPTIPQSAWLIFDVELLGIK